MNEETTRELTYGEKAVGLTFNPDQNPDVNDVKKAYAGIIDGLKRERDLCTREQDPANGEKARLLSIAITEAQTAQMWAVKAITWQF
jgi:hypothetical protein